MLRSRPSQQLCGPADNSPLASVFVQPSTHAACASAAGTGAGERHTRRCAGMGARTGTTRRPRAAGAGEGDDAVTLADSTARGIGAGTLSGHAARRASPLQSSRWTASGRPVRISESDWFVPLTMSASVGSSCSNKRAVSASSAQSDAAAYPRRRHVFEACSAVRPGPATRPQTPSRNMRRMPRGCDERRTPPEADAGQVLGCWMHGETVATSA
mmetsp:Transcript_33129/g.82328  ORF Transcript_33129/g.82328 Transcript_33129/m.82328 type:complete len:214 (-) Transcript_33129:493-1134(-)